MEDELRVYPSHSQIYIEPFFACNNMLASIFSWLPSFQIFFQLQTSQKDGFGRPGSEDHSCTSQPQCCPSDQWGGPQCSPQGNIIISISTTHRKTKAFCLNRLLHLKMGMSTCTHCRKCAPLFWRQTSTSEWWRSWGRTSRSALTLRRWHRLDKKRAWFRPSLIIFGRDWTREGWFSKPCLGNL